MKRAASAVAAVQGKQKEKQKSTVAGQAPSAREGPPSAGDPHLYGSQVGGYDHLWVLFRLFFLCKISRGKIRGKIASSPFSFSMALYKLAGPLVYLNGLPALQKFCSGVRP
ncbi:hypothetical protein CCHR01_17172 [Colletotrichum chrysophilum]|uniref:Uncharacterized protein n=1 Tax=Colletotrichum chrysophilum TaxID=1836956 RepID=A0AAD9A2K6_9PEZI|nr:hypothetical protein CCHR01_17172 [Colletotrichum chrysophilum]